MGGFFSVLPEITGRTTDASSEMKLPDPIGHHAGGQWILGIDQPFGQDFASAAALSALLGGGNHRIGESQNLGKSRLHLSPFGVGIPTQQNMRDRRFRSVFFHCQRFVQFRQALFAELFEFLLNRKIIVQLLLAQYTRPLFGNHRATCVGVLGIFFFRIGKGRKHLLFVLFDPFSQALNLLIVGLLEPFVPGDLLR